MTDSSLTTNRLKAYRLSRGWTQAELAVRAVISRAAVSAIEINRLVPSVAAALALARVLGCTVEDLFGHRSVIPLEPRWAWTPPTSPCRFWRARMKGDTILYPVEATATGEIAHDGVFNGDAYTTHSESDPDTTLVVACCDPAVGLLAAEYAHLSGFRLIALTRSSRQALALLQQGLVHVAGLHFATAEEPEGNARAVRDTLGTDAQLLRVARWQEGLSVQQDAPVSSVRQALKAKLRWVGRESGSAARQCMDELLPNRPPPRHFAHDHRGVAEAVRNGWADIGVCHRLVSDEAGLRFLSVRQENYDLCYALADEFDPRLAALTRAIRSTSYRRLLSELPGYETEQTGEMYRAR